MLLMLLWHTQPELFANLEYISLHLYIPNLKEDKPQPLKPCESALSAYRRKSSESY